MSDYGIDYEQADYSGLERATPLIDEFYDDPEVFDNWYGDACTDHEKQQIEVIRTQAVCIRGETRRMAGAAQRGDWESHAEYDKTREHYLRKFGKEMYTLINGYMEKASERCK